MTTGAMTTGATTSGRPRRRRDLAPLLAPASIALVGASARPKTPGNAMARMLRLDGYAGRVTAVNPNYRDVEGIPCVASLAALPEPVEHAVLSVPNAGLEAALDEAIARGVRAVTIFASCHLDDDREPPLARRLTDKADAAGVLICGGSSMGFYNLSLGLRVATFLSAPGMARGGIAWIAQSGSVFGALAHNDRRLRFSLCVSSGAELNVSVADYMRYALQQPETRVIGLFLEAVRDPQGFTAALESAAERGIPVVVLKVGRSVRSAAMAATHTGALAGNDAAYRALFRRYGVIRVDDLDEMAATLALFEQPRRAAPGGLAAIHDSGGERELLVDLAEQEGVVFGEIGSATTAALAARLDPGLLAENPLDAWGTGRDFQAVYSDCLSALLADPGVGAGLFVSDPRDDYWYSAACIAAAETAAAATDKPVAIVSNYTLTDDRRQAQRLAAAGVPLIKGTRNALRAMKQLFAQRDFAARRRATPPPPSPGGAARHWRDRLAGGTTLSEREGLALLADYGIAIPRALPVATRDEAIDAAQQIGFPVALKTANPAITHKSDQGGVALGLSDAAAVGRAYDAMAARCGPAALVAEMASGLVGDGVEIGLGALDDPAFGPVVMVAAGGTLIELFRDSAVALAPFGSDEALALLRSLRVAPLLQAQRGRPAADLEHLAETIARFSLLAAELAGSYSQIDVNPVIAGPRGAVAVDALIAGRSA